MATLAKGVQSGGEKVGVFCNGYNEVVFLCKGTYRHEIRAKTVFSIEPL